MSSISPVTSVVGSQIPIPPSINQAVPSNASNPASNLATQQNLYEANNAGTAASNAIGTGESSVKGILQNLNLSPANKV